MSKKSNVNPDHYKVAGRERQGENIVQSAQSQAYGPPDCSSSEE